MDYRYLKQVNSRYAGKDPSGLMWLGVRLRLHASPII
jgi:hypothetical protein